MNIFLLLINEFIIVQCILQIYSTVYITNIYIFVNWKIPIQYLKYVRFLLTDNIDIK